MDFNRYWLHVFTAVAVFKIFQLFKVPRSQQESSLERTWYLHDDHHIRRTNINVSVTLEKVSYLMSSKKQLLISFVLGSMKCFEGKVTDAIVGFSWTNTRDTTN